MRSVTLLFNFAEQPGAGMGPIIVGSTGGNPQNLGGFLKGQAHETAQLDQFRFDLCVGRRVCQELHSPRGVRLHSPGAAISTPSKSTRCWSPP